MVHSARLLITILPFVHENWSPAFRCCFWYFTPQETLKKKIIICGLIHIPRFPVAYCPRRPPCWPYSPKMPPLWSSTFPCTRVLKSNAIVGHVQHSDCHTNIVFVLVTHLTNMLPSLTVNVKGCVCWTLSCGWYRLVLWKDCLHVALRHPNMILLFDYDEKAHC